MFTHFIEMPFESPLFHFNQFKELECEKPVEEVVYVHEVCKLDHGTRCLDKVIRDYLTIRIHYVEQVESY